MRKMRKLLSLLLVLAMTISLAVPMVAASEFTDVADTHPYSSAIQSLVARGIVNGMGDGTFAPDANVTRAQFAKMVILSIGMGNSIGTTVDTTGFPDVATDHWAAPYIKAAFGQAIINGFEDGTFKPDENVTYEQAITMAVRAKSLFLKAEADKIGYPQGYIQVATKYQMLKGIIDGVNGQPAKRGTIAKLMDNMIKSELPDEMGGLPNLDTTDETEEVKGQVLAVKGTSLISGDTDSLNTYQIKVELSNGSIAVFDARNLAIKDSLRSYLGKLVVIYYDEDISSNIQRITSMSEQRNRNYVETVTLDKINDYSDTFVEYDDARDNEERINVSGSATIVYNGRVTASDIDDLITANLTRAGSIQFLCTEGEGSPADVIFFTSYTNWYVTSTTPSSKTVYGEKAGVKDSIVIDDESRTKNVTITKDGKTASFSSIAKGQILSISKSDDNSVIDVIISDDTVSGLVQGKNTDKNTLTVQAKEYTFTDGIDVSTINLGITLKLYLDAFGKVAKYTHQTTSSNLTYGYLLTASVDGNSMNPQVALKILKLNTTSTSSPDELYLADTVTINNTNYKPINDADGILTLLKDTAEYYDAASGDYEFASGKVFQPIRYSKNAEGKISSLYIGTQSVTATDSDLKVDRSFADVGDEITCTMTGSNPTFQYLYKLNSATKVVYVPDNDTDRANNDKYIIRNGNNAGFTQGVQYRIVMVDTSTSSTPAVVIVYSDPSGVSSTEWEECTPKLVVDKSRGTGEYEYEIMLEGSNGEATPYYDETGSFYGAVNIGDVVRVSVSTGNKVEEFEVAAEAKEIYAGTEYIKPITHLTEVAREVDKSGTPMNGTYPLHKEGDRSVTRKIVMYAGVAFDIVENSMLIAMDYPEAANWDKTALTNAGNLRNINVSGAKVLVVEFNNGIVDNIEASDVGQIMTYEDAEVNANKLFVYCYGDTANLIVVYRSR